MERWVGRTALVTGASAGIGRCITIELLKHGVNVVACARRVEAIEAIKEDAKDAKGQLMPVKCDVSKEDEILAMFEKIKASDLKGVDICINNAGFGDLKPLSEGDTSVWRNMFEVNVLGLSICTRKALKSMEERSVNDGHIIHISSLFCHELHTSIPRSSAPFYTATKCAVRALTECLRQELAAKKSGTRVTEISPGPVQTEFGKLGNEEIINAYFQSNPYLRGEDVAGAVIHALSASKHVQVHEMIVEAIAQP